MKITITGDLGEPLECFEVERKFTKRTPSEEAKILRLHVEGVWPAPEKDERQ